MTRRPEPRLGLIGLFIDPLLLAVSDPRLLAWIADEEPVAVNAPPQGAD